MARHPILQRMKSSSSRLAFTATAVVAFLFGIGITYAVFFLVLDSDRKLQSGDSVGSLPTIENVGTTDVQDGTSNESSPIGAPNETLGSIHDIVDIKSPFERGLALRNVLARSNERRVIDLLAESLELPNHSNSLELQSDIIHRLAQINPSRALSQAIEIDKREPRYSGKLVKVVFQEWARSDLEEAVANARLLSESVRGSATEAILLERMDLSEDQALSIARDLENERVATSLFTQMEVEEAVENPDELWSDLVSKLQGDIQNWTSISRVANAWVEKRGLSVLDQIFQSLTNSQIEVHVTRDVLRAAVQIDPKGALEYALNLEEDLYNIARWGVIEAWATSDPKAALAALSEIEEESLRTELEGTAIRAWASYSDPYELLDSVSTLPSHLQGSATTNALYSISWRSPREAAQLIEKLESGPTKTKAASDLVDNWSRGDSKAALDWILNEPSNKDMQSLLLVRVIGRLAAVDPERAWTVAIGQPIPDGEVGMELRVITSLVQENIDRALEFLPQVREGQTRLGAYRNVARALVQDKDVDRALNLLPSVSVKEKSAVFETIAATWARSNAEELLNSMDRFDTRELKSKAAMALVLSNRYWNPALSDKQIEEAKSFLTDEDKLQLEVDNASSFSRW
ncbi:MAG: hypothetical protein F4Z66_10265 [Gammaproteobacteria bacterium]|nr:hypothetical protein [Gammaproteobacteria bacterium]